MAGKREAAGRANRRGEGRGGGPGETGAVSAPLPATAPVEAGLPARPRSVLEVRVFPGGIEVHEYYSEGRAEALAEALAACGVRTSRRFASRCG